MQRLYRRPALDVQFDPALACRVHLRGGTAGNWSMLQWPVLLYLASKVRPLAVRTSLTRPLVASIKSSVAWQLILFTPRFSAAAIRLAVARAASHEPASGLKYAVWNPSVFVPSVTIARLVNSGSGMLSVGSAARSRKRGCHARPNRPS